MSPATVKGSQPDCYVAAQPTGGNPNAPTALSAEIATFEFFGQTDVAWTDNADNETCFVVERKFVDQEYEVIATLAADTTEYRDEGPYDQGDWLFYRVYAATSTQRSFYSNEDQVSIPHVDPTPTSSPTPSSSPTLVPGRPRGDANCDGDIDPVDAMALLRADAGLEVTLPNDCIELDAMVVATDGLVAYRKGDLNCNGGIDPIDSLVVLRYDAGLDLMLDPSCWALDTEVWPAP